MQIKIVIKIFFSNVFVTAFERLFPSTQERTQTHTVSLIEAVSLDYAQHLQSIGLSRGTRHYFGKAGERGRQLLEQYLTSSPRSKT